MGNELAAPSRGASRAYSVKARQIAADALHVLQLTEAPSAGAIRTEGLRHWTTAILGNVSRDDLEEARHLLNDASSLKEHLYVLPQSELSRLGVELLTAALLGLDLRS